MGVGCVLRLSGVQFDVDRFLATSGLIARVSWKTGDQRGKSRPPKVDNGCNIVVSETEAVSQQCRDAIRFFTANGDLLKKLAAIWKISDSVLDFSLTISEDNGVSAEFTRFPAELLTNMGAAGCSLCFSRYLVSNRTIH